MCWLLCRWIRFDVCQQGQHKHLHDRQGYAILLIATNAYWACLRGLKHHANVGHHVQGVEGDGAACGHGFILKQ